MFNQRRIILNRNLKPAVATWSWLMLYDRDQQRAVVNTVMNQRALEKTGNVLTI
jgi:hypothetical protein